MIEKRLTCWEIFAILNTNKNDTNHDHAVTVMSSGESYVYVANGNQTQRNFPGRSFTLAYDAENRLVSVTGSATATFVYDGNGNRVQGTVSSTTTSYVGNYAEWVNGETYPLVKYYYAGGTRVVMRKCQSNGSCLSNEFIFGDHLGSTSVTTDSSGNNPIYIWYYPWGKERYTSGTIPTSYRFTGQRLESSIGLYYYGA